MEKVQLLVLGCSWSSRGDRLRHNSYYYIEDETSAGIILGRKLMLSKSPLILDRSGGLRKVSPKDMSVPGGKFSQMRRRRTSQTE